MRHRFDIAITAAALAAATATTPVLAEDKGARRRPASTLGPLVVQLTPLGGQQAPWVDFDMAYQPAINNFTLVEAQAVTVPGLAGTGRPTPMGPLKRSGRRMSATWPMPMPSSSMAAALRALRFKPWAWATAATV